MHARELLFPPGATARDWVADGAVAATLMLAQLASGPILGDPYETATRWELFVCLGMAASLVFRRHAPLLTLGLVSVFGIAHLSVLNHPTISLAAVPLVSYAVARWIPGVTSRIVLVIGAAASLFGPYRWFLDQRAYLPFTQQSGVLFFTFACLCFGAVASPYIVGRRGLESEQARTREREAREAQARLDEASTRTMIARELHDVVAHSLSLMIVQAEGGRALARKNPDAAAETLDTIAEVGRQSLEEMRHIVAVLRRGPTEADFSPAPTLDDIPALVQRTSEHATVVVRGTPVRQTPAQELTVYRIVQEALTNVLKHAGPDARATVVLTYAPAQLTAEITDDGTGPAAGNDGDGNGLRGMAERVRSMGGSLQTGPRPGGGFRVCVSLPLRPDHHLPDDPGVSP